MFLSLAVLIVYLNGVFGDLRSYNRTGLQEQYPGFGNQWLPFYQDDGSVVVGLFEAPSNETVRLSFTPPVEEATSFTLYTRSSRKGIEITEKNLHKVDKSKPLKFITHGWLSSGSADTCQTIKNAFLDKHDVNVIIVDWGPISSNVFYPIPMRSTTDVGNYYGSFLEKLIKTGVNPKDIHLIGHSLGAHASGFAARKIRNSGKIGRVTALDPALPGFETVEMVSNGKLEKDDADFVDVIHTCAGFFGYSDPIGHADFYPNGGSAPQPGCSILEMIESCSHGRSWQYFRESITAKAPFLAQKCPSANSIDKGSCKGEAVPMGEPAPNTTRGIYYLETLSDPPFVLFNPLGDNSLE